MGSEMCIRDRIKKPKSMVPGDLPPVLVNELAKECSVPLAAIYSEMPSSTWPKKMEEGISDGNS